MRRHANDHLLSMHVNYAVLLPGSNQVTVDIGVRTQFLNQFHADRNLVLGVVRGNLQTLRAEANNDLAIIFWGYRRDGLTWQGYGCAVQFGDVAVNRELCKVHSG